MRHHLGDWFDPAVLARKVRAAGRTPTCASTGGETRQLPGDDWGVEDIASIGRVEDFRVIGYAAIQMYSIVEII